MALFDTDVLVWYLRGNRRAARAIDAAEERFISVITYMELLQGARNRKEVREIKHTLLDFGFAVLPLTENISNRAVVYMEEYGLKVAMGYGDALIAATAVEHSLVLITGNRKHYSPVRELRVRQFRP